MRLLVVIFAAFGVHGCTTMEVQREAMIPPPMPLTRSAPTRGLSVAVERQPEPRGIPGLSVTLAMWSDDAFRAAVGEAALQSRLFGRVVPEGPADYALVVTILNVTQPAFGFDMTVTMAADWSLRRGRDDVVLGREFVPSSCRKSVGDAFGGRDRLLLATECAARENIAEGLRRMERLLDRSPDPTTGQ